MSWTVRLTSKAVKQTERLAESIRLRVRTLVQEMAIRGPVRGNWKSYGKLGKAKHHCHVKSGRPTYVVCWEVIDVKDEHIVEVYYVGTHEGAPY